MAPYLNEGELELLKNNRNAVMYEPLVVGRRLRHGQCSGSLPLTESFLPDWRKKLLRQQAACLAASLAGKLDRWTEFHDRLNDVDVEHPREVHSVGHRAGMVQ